MNTSQLEKARETWAFAMDISLENGRILVANDGYITDNPNDLKKGKHCGEYAGFYYFSKRKGTTQNILNVINSISNN